LGHFNFGSNKSLHMTDHKYRPMRSLCRLQLPSLVTGDGLAQAKAQLKQSQLHLHRLELSQRILGSQQGKSDNDKNTVFRLLLPHIHLQDVTILSLRRDLLSERISKQFLFQDPLEDKRSLVLNFEWVCEQHTNPHMDINSFQSDLSMSAIGGAPTALFSINETTETISAEAIEEQIRYLSSFTSACLQSTKDGQQCRYQATQRDLMWFLSFLLTHPSDTAFDAVSALLMK
jgi:hypothetical protein